MLQKIIVLLVLATGSLAPACAFGQDTLRTFIFGHSLINHEFQVNPTPSQETSVPHWFHFLSQAAGDRYEVAGQYGFLGGHANLPPIAQWGFDSVPAAWDDLNETFSQANFDNILLTPANFVQWQPPYANYPNDNQSPLDYTRTIFNWTNQQEDSLNLYVYENWPDMGGFLSNGFPPTQAEWTSYNNYLNADFHDWFVEYHDSLMQAFPNSCVRMIPAGPAISSLLATPPYNQIAIDTLYEDDAPHGRPTVYFLAALVTYMAMHEEPAPANYQAPGIIDPIITNNYTDVVNHLWTFLNNYNLPSGQSRVFCNNSVPLDISATDPSALPDPNEVLDLAVYPSPTTGQLSIQTSLNQYDLVVTDLQGRIVRTAAENPIRVDLTQVPAGIYFVRVRDLETGRVETRKVMKQ